MKRLLFACVLAAGCAGTDKAPPPASRPTAPEAVRATITIEGERVEGGVAIARLRLENPTEHPLVLFGWEIRLDGRFLDGVRLTSPVSADSAAMDPDGTLTLTCRWDHDDLPAAEARSPRPSVLTGKKLTGWCRASSVLAPGASTEWVVRFALPLGGKVTRVNGRISWLDVPALGHDVLAASPGNPSTDPDEAWKAWMRRAPNPSPTELDREPEVLTLKFERGGTVAAGCLVHERALQTFALTSEQSSFPTAKQRYTLEEAQRDLDLRGSAAWAGAWIVSDGQSTGLARPGESFRIPGDHVESFRQAWLDGLADFNFPDQVPPAVQAVAGEGGPVKGGGTEVTVPAEKLFEFARAVHGCGWKLNGRSASP